MRSVGTAINHVLKCSITLLIFKCLGNGLPKSEYKINENIWKRRM